MRILSAISVLCFLAVSAGCSAIYDVSFDYDDRYRFKQLETYDWVLIETNDNVDTITVQRIKDAVNSNLESKGFRLKDSNPDFVIATHVGSRQRLAGAPDPYMAAYGPYWSAPPPRHYEEGKLVLDFVDPANNQLIWRGSAKADVSGIRKPEQIEKIVNEAVEAILMKFPPQ